MRPGPEKQFDPGEALETARNVFWRNGYDGTAISMLESEMGIGRKSLYDTFGGKRELYVRALEQYVDSVIGRICRGLEDPRSSAIQNLERVLGRLQQHHGSSESLGCLLGVAMGQADRDDEELASVLRGFLETLERAFERCLKQARVDGAVRESVRPKDVARQLVALTQGMALLGRVSEAPTLHRSVVRATLDAIRT